MSLSATASRTSSVLSNSTCNISTHNSKTHRSISISKSSWFMGVMSQNVLEKKPLAPLDVAKDINRLSLTCNEYMALHYRLRNQSPRASAIQFMLLISV